MASGFVSEKVLDEKRQQRQAEWEKVRKPEEPEIAPEAPQETRSLFDQLQANRSKVQEDWDEAHKLKNQIRGIDDDEAEFLDQVDNVRESVDRQRRMEERSELEAYRARQAELMEKELEERTNRLRTEGQGPATATTSAAADLQKGGGRKRSSESSSSSSQAKLLMAAVKKKRPAAVAPEVTVPEPCKDEPGNAVSSKSSLGALAGLGDYDSSSEEEEEEER